MAGHNDSYYLSNAMLGQNINLPVCVCVCVSVCVCVRPLSVNSPTDQTSDILVLEFDLVTVFII